MKKIILIVSLIIVAILILVMTGIIPKVMGKLVAIKYVKENYSNLDWKFEKIEFFNLYGAYYAYFKESENQSYVFRLNSKYFPTHVVFDGYHNSTI